MLTADTITDEQIRALRNDPDPTIRNEAEMATSTFHRVMGRVRYVEARRYCAEIINARSK